MAYPCFCTEEELSGRTRAAEKNKENFGYYGGMPPYGATVRWRTSRQSFAGGTPYVVRFPLGGQH